MARGMLRRLFCKAGYGSGRLYGDYDTHCTYRSEFVSWFEMAYPVLAPCNELALMTMMMMMRPFVQKVSVLEDVLGCLTHYIHYLIIPDPLSLSSHPIASPPTTSAQMALHQLVFPLPHPPLRS